MKKTLTVNLGGTVYHIDEDAYRLLDKYLKNLKIHFRKQVGADEIVMDIENRISELFSEELRRGVQVITILHVQEVIDRMGRPEELATEEDETHYRNDAFNSSQKKEYTSQARHRLYRNPDDVLLGGVISGMAAYIGCDVTLLRLIMVVLLFFSAGTMIVIYLVCWLLIPAAQTAEEKLSMRGEEINLENIGKTVTDGFEKVSNGVNDYIQSDKPRNFFQRLGDTLVTVIGFTLKAVLVLVAIVCSPLLFVMALLFVLLIVAVIVALIGGGAALFSLLPTLSWEPISASPIIVIVSCVAGILLVGIPLAAIIFAILRLIFNWNPMAGSLKWTLVYLWVVGAVIFVISLAQMGWQFPMLMF